MHFHKTVFSEKFSTDIARSSLYSFHPMLFTVFQSVTFIFPLHDTYDQPLFTSLATWMGNRYTAYTYLYISILQIKQTINT